LHRADYIAFQYAPQIRAVAVNHALIIDIGVANYILTMLVPELTVQLIKEDMQVDQDRACAILRESAGIGELLNDD
jgi:hypothetical protein